MTGLQPAVLLAQISRAAARHQLFVSGTVQVPAVSDTIPAPVSTGTDPVPVSTCTVPVPAGPGTFQKTLTEQMRRGDAPGPAATSDRSSQIPGETGGNPPVHPVGPSGAGAAIRPAPGPEAGAGTGATAWLALLSADEPGFWPHVTGQPEFRDGMGDPLDRWSRRVVTSLAQELGGAAVFPFGGPPWHPFLRWAEGSGRSFPSPVVLHVHDRMGLWASWRGALVFASPLPAMPAANPCLSCAGQPCRTACPAGAMRGDGYDIAACHAWLDSPAGADCLAGGCLVRRACPVSRLYGRLEAESAHHMRHFHP